MYFEESQLIIRVGQTLQSFDHTIAIDMTGSKLSEQPSYILNDIKLNVMYHCKLQCTVLITVSLINYCVFYCSASRGICK